MEKKRSIHDLDSLEREMQRLKKEAAEIEGKLDNNIHHLRENFSSIAMRSFFCSRKNKAADKGSKFNDFLTSEKLNSVVGKIADRMVEQAEDGIDKFLDKIFAKNKRSASE